MYSTYSASAYTRYGAYVTGIFFNFTVLRVCRDFGLRNTG